MQDAFFLKVVSKRGVQYILKTTIEIVQKYSTLLTTA
jgi:hypothetical protein